VYRSCAVLGTLQVVSIHIELVTFDYSGKAPAPLIWPYIYSTHIRLACSLIQFNVGYTISGLL